MGESPTKARSRLHFLPDGFDFDAQPAAFKAAYDNIIEPTYKQLVVAPRDALERATGMTIVFLLVEELLDQQILGLEFDQAKSKPSSDPESREKALNRHLRLVSAKQTALNAYLRVRKLAQQPRFFSINPPIHSPSASPQTPIHTDTNHGKP
jgi:hypothetical protein